MSEDKFDFEAWSNLAVSDPTAFETKRREMIEKLIEDAPEELRQRLRSFQWRIDMERERSNNPLQACIRISNMMWDLIYADRGFLWSLQAMSDPNSLLNAVAAEGGSADIVALQPRSAPKPDSR